MGVAFWQVPAVQTVLVVLLLLGAAEALMRLAPPLRRIGIPASIIGGTLGLLAGPDIAGWLPLDRSVLELGVYHGLAIVFIAIGLQSPKGGTAGPDARSMGFAIPTMVALQTVIGLGFVLGVGLLATPTHPGLGLLLPLGFEQGPGQALSLGAAWEASGLTDGRQIGLIIAAVGFGWSILIGVPLVAWGRSRRLRSGEHGTASEAPAPAPPAPAGGLGPLSRQIAAIAAVYALTYAVCAGLSAALAGMPDIAAMVWGFHFIFGAALALGARRLLDRAPGAPILHDATLAEVASVTVDGITAGAIAAIEVAVLRANLVPIAVLTTLGGVATLIAAVWLAGRAFRSAPFEHCVLWFGMSTGTLPMGLALLRVLDPDLRSPAPMSAVLGSALSVPLVAPIVLGIHPLPIAGYPGSWPGAGWTALALSTAYLVILLVAWWRLGGLRPVNPTRLWHIG
ncbi:MAG: ESS family glutamate:Na+ symporter [Myxococcota bacterium]